MTTKLYPMKNVAPANFDNEGYPQYIGKSAVRKEYVYQYTQEINPIPSKAFEITVEQTDRNNNDKNGNIQDIILEGDFTNTDGSGNCVFDNVYKMFNEVELREDGVIVDKLRDNNDVFLRASENLFRDNMKSSNDLACEISRNLNITGETLPSFTVADSGTAYLRLSILNLFPKLRNRNTRSFGKLTLKFTFAPIQAASLQTLYVKSSTTVNNFATVVANNLALRTIVNTNPDPRLILNSQKDWIRVYDTKVKTGAFNTAGTDSLKVNLKNDFTLHNNCVGMYVYAESPDNRTAHNSANASMYASLPETICPVISLDGDVILDHKHADSKLIDRRRYCLDAHKSTWSTSLDPLALGSGNMSKIHVPVYYIDFTNLGVAENQEQVLTGISSQTNMDIQVFCGNTGVDADNTNMYFSLVYLQCVDRSSGVPRVSYDSVDNVYAKKSKY